ncbi:uncharacterized protein LOC129584463 [Paramacrobiotus metropolitanus]|uniref:uncharacterized protein LOC129584463 n=1 Tax=Paramacrobiotus metropolitanus TaxID=2943436 RepID=UPI002445C841|nr:uncharacterized protein LOC129584463 [Paramacrobiotus metropolitanus]XP_055332605.1 uncharacterized protein LOC129584463 [Paramacrobiotus metropolitanus]XP_055332606.1 uncharacterized protein LOC129584463 [Paramacrobiotus metropolitanus]XP_055332607.1 uncharacterized protein LOC129584463 [Paramacrobiotus metropolitanus]
MDERIPDTTKTGKSESSANKNPTNPTAYNPILEAEIDYFYKTMFPEEENREDILDLNEIFHDLHEMHGETNLPNESSAASRSAQMEKLSESSLSCVFLTVHRMFESYEMQLWDIVPVITVKESIEDVVGVSPDDMRIYMKPDIVLENQKSLRDYGITPDTATASEPAKLFVGFRVDLEELSEDEGPEDEEEEDDELELSPGLEYFETLSDIDFTEDIERQRDFDDRIVEVEYGPEYKLTKPVNMCQEGQLTIPRAPGEKPAASLTENHQDSDDSEEDSFVPFTLKKPS